MSLLFLPAEETFVRVSRRFLRRLRICFWGCLCGNIVLLVLVAGSVKDRRQTHELARIVSALGKHSQEITGLYSDQIEELSYAYDLYGRALRAKDQQGADYFAAYQEALNSCQERSVAMVQVSRKIARQEQRLRQWEDDQ